MQLIANEIEVDLVCFIVLSKKIFLSLIIAYLNFNKRIMMRHVFNFSAADISNNETTSLFGSDCWMVDKGFCEANLMYCVIQTFVFTIFKWLKCCLEHWRSQKCVFLQIATILIHVSRGRMNVRSTHRSIGSSFKPHTNCGINYAWNRSTMALRYIQLWLIIFRFRVIYDCNIFSHFIIWKLLTW